MTGRIFITGDKHGSLVPFFGLAQRNELTPADILLIAGDAGYVWREHDSSPLTTLQQLFPGTVAFVDGNHENHALLNSMEVQLWNGGRVHRVDERVYHLMRGELYSIDGTTGKENRSGRIGKHRIYHSACCYRIRYASVRIDF